MNDSNALALLSNADVQQFHRDGYLRFRRVIDDAMLARLRDELKQVQDELRAGPRPDWPPEITHGNTAAVGDRLRAIHQFINVWKIMPSYAEVIHNSSITGAVRELMATERIRLWHDQVISKPPGENDLFPCHHDFYFWPLDRPRMITCWLALDDADEDNGCMHVVPGSHRDPRFQPPDCDLSPDIHLAPEPGGEGEPGSLYDDVRTWPPNRAKPVRLQAGECMFHHCLNYHLTPQNTTERPRRALILIFMPDGARYRHEQSPAHVCTRYLELADGEVMDRPEFPLCGS